MTTDTAAELEQFFFYLKIYAKDTHNFIRHAMETGTAGEINPEGILPDLKKWESNFKKAIELIETNTTANNSK